MTNNKISVDIGLDVSTSCVGFCILEHNTGKLIKLLPIKLTSTKFEDLYDKGDYVKDFLQKEIEENYIIKNIFIEDIAQKFSAGFSSAQTITTLAKMNAICCYISYSLFNIKPIHINVRSARSCLNIKITKEQAKLDKKRFIFEIVRDEKIPEFNGWATHVAKTGKHKGKMVYDACNYDCADSWVVAMGGKMLLDKNK